MVKVAWFQDQSFSFYGRFKIRARTQAWAVRPGRMVTARGRTLTGQGRTRSSRGLATLGHSAYCWPSQPLAIVPVDHTAPSAATLLPLRPHVLACCCPPCFAPWRSCCRCHRLAIVSAPPPLHFCAAAGPVRCLPLLRAHG